jgi:hypothetical protein
VGPVGTEAAVRRPEPEAPLLHEDSAEPGASAFTAQQSDGCRGGAFVGFTLQPRRKGAATTTSFSTSSPFSEEPLRPTSEVVRWWGDLPNSMPLYVGAFPRSSAAEFRVTF